MRFRQYYLAHDCPQCGAKDEKDSWGGARMWSTEWGHGFSCCGDECGKAFAVKHKEQVKSRAGRKDLAELWERLAGQAEYRLTGEPYSGYDAEQQLKHRRF